jgi:RNA polymerase sigma factor (sigma-70 family)
MGLNPYTIVTSLCRNRVRDHSRRSRVLVADNEESPAAESMGKTQSSRNENEGNALVRVREMLSRLPNKQREALNLRYFAGLDYAAIAAALGCSPEGGRANISQAMRKLKGLR